MCISKANIRSAMAAATLAAALAGLGGDGGRGRLASAAGGRLSLHGHPRHRHQVPTVDLSDLGTCHTLSEPCRAVQVVNGSASLLLFSGAQLHRRATRGPADPSLQSDLPWAMLSYRVIRRNGRRTRRARTSYGKGTGAP
ncbi:hypothetical protein, partial [Streptomyces xanthochromogenes]